MADMMSPQVSSGVANEGRLAHRDAMRRRGRDIDVRTGTADGDQSQVRQARQKRGRDRRALAQQHQGFDRLETLGEAVDIGRRIGPDRDRMACDFRKRG